MKKSFNIFVFLLCGLVLSAQEYRGDIRPVNEDGVYAIPLSPEVHSASLDRTDGIRILDEEHNEIPYWVHNGTDKREDARFVPFPIVSKTALPEKRSSVIIENKEKKAIDRISLKIAATKVSKTYDISGSDDGENWFGLVNGEILGRLSTPGKTTVEKSFAFPLNRYRYLRWDFDDEKTLPVNILEAGIYEKPDKTGVPELTELKGFTLETVQDKANKKTIIHIRFAEPQRINTLTFDIAEGPGMFLRTAHIRAKRNRNVKKRTETYVRTMGTLELDSQKENRFDKLNLFEKEFTIEIKNRDNLPLEDIGVRIFQEPVYLVAELRAGKKYRLAVNPSFPSPQYDIGHFKTLFRDDLPRTGMGTLKKIPPEETTPGEIPFWKTGTFLWLCIITAAVFISWFSWRLLRDMKN